jgi:hypothetical protein
MITKVLIPIIFSTMVLCPNAFAKPDNARPDVDVNVVNTPDVNVVNTPDVNVVNTPDVSVTNFPDTQTVSGTVSVDNLPVVQTVSVDNLPAVQDVKLIDSGKQQIEIHETLDSLDGPAVPAKISNPTDPLFPILNGQVPSGKKMVLTDILVNYAVRTSNGVAALNIRRATSDTGGCGGGSLGLRHQVRISNSSTHNTNLSTGIEFYENEYLCMSTGLEGPAISVTIFGYFEDM